MKVAVIGAGYVGLVTAAGFAEAGNEVVCIDTDSPRIRALQHGHLPIYEPSLDALVELNVNAGRLQFTDTYAEALHGVAAVFLTVGTPALPDGAADLSGLFAAVEQLVEHLSGACILIIKSTVPVGTNARIARAVRRCPHAIEVVSNPEFLKEGTALQDFFRPDRIVIGCWDAHTHAHRLMQRLYKPLNLDTDRIIWTQPTSAELIKYVSNAMLAMRISFMNEVATLCERVGADINTVRHGLGSDKRIGSKFLYASPGYGGSCFPKDVLAFVATGREHGVDLELAAVTHRVNEKQKGLLFRKLKRHFSGALHARRVAVWGVAFKPCTDDIRESPALTLIEALLSEGAEVCCHDPAALPALDAHFQGRIIVQPEAYEAARGADALVLVTEWREYQSANFERLRALMRGNVLLDGRNVWASYALGELGFHYEGIGIPRETWR